MKTKYITLISLMLLNTLVLGNAQAEARASGPSTLPATSQPGMPMPPEPAQPTPPVPPPQSNVPLPPQPDQPLPHQPTLPTPPSQPDIPTPPQPSQPLPDQPLPQPPLPHPPSLPTPPLQPNAPTPPTTPSLPGAPIHPNQPTLPVPPNTVPSPNHPAHHAHSTHQPTRHRPGVFDLSKWNRVWARPSWCSAHYSHQTRPRLMKTPAGRHPLPKTALTWPYSDQVGLPRPVGAFGRRKVSADLRSRSDAIRIPKQPIEGNGLRPSGLLRSTGPTL
jgi:hypothetical protein